MVEESDFKFDDKLRQQIHYDWGKCYKRLGKNESARKQFLDSLSLKENAHGPMEQLSKCYLERADAPRALELANQCLKNFPKITRHNYHRNECIYDCNEFETCLVERYRLAQDKKAVALGSVDAIKMTELTLDDSIGNQTGSFLHYFRKALAELDKIEATAEDTRPLWKIRRDKKECDVVSICSDSNELAKQKTIEHPLDLHRLRKKQKRIRSLYFSTPTVETYDFLRNLPDDPRLNFPPSEESTKTIRTAVEEKLKVFKKFEGMLQQRQPIYAKRNILSKNNNEKFSAVTLLRMQETIEHRAKSQLDKIQKMKDTDFPGLLAFVEDIMTNFYLIKCEKVFPKKLEFLESIYNIVGVCYIDTIQTDLNSDYVSYMFEDALNYRHSFTIPKKFNFAPGLKTPNEHFLKRLQYANNAIEKCYIYHQLSRLYFEQTKLIESKEMGEELVNTAKSINNDTWMLLGYLRVMLVDATIGENEKVRANVQELRKLKVDVRESVWKFLEKALSKSKCGNFILK